MDCQSFAKSVSTAVETLCGDCLSARWSELKKFDAVNKHEPGRKIGRICLDERDISLETLQDG